MPRASTPPTVMLQRAAAALLLTIAAAVLLGWLLDISALKTVLPGLTTMKANTAVALGAGGGALLLMSAETRATRAAALAAAALMGAIGALTMAEYLGRLNLGIDQLLVLDPATTSRPFNGRMSPASAMSFASSAAAIALLACGRSRRAALIGHAFAVPPAMIGFVSLAAYSYGVSSQYSFGPYLAVALHTAVGLLVLAGGLLAVRPREGWAHAYVQRPIARAALLQTGALAVMAPFVTGLLVMQGVRAGWYQALFAPAAFAAVAALVFVALAFHSASVLARAELALADARTQVEQVAAEAAAGDRRHRALVEGLPQLVWTCLPNGDCDYVSPQWVDYTGRSLLEQLGGGWLDQLHPGDVDRSLAQWMRAVAGQAAYDIEYRLRAGDGSHRWFKGVGKPVRNAQGEITYWLGTCTDIQEIVEAREVLARSRLELEAEVQARIAAQALAERRRRAAFETSYILQVLLDPAGAILDVNATGLDLIGPTPGPLAGAAFAQAPWFADTPGMCARMSAAVAEVGAGGVFREELTFDLPTGRRCFDFAMRPIRDPDGGVGAIVAEAVELTERRRAEAELIAAREAALSSARAEANFLANMSHELRTPLNSIVGFSGVVCAAEELLPETRRRAGLVEAASQSLLAIVNDILDFSKFEADGVALNAEAVDPLALLVAAADLIRPETERKGVRLSVESAFAGGPRLTDPIRLRQVLLNLIGNAVKFTHEGAIRCTLDAAADGALTLAIHDTGVGVPPDQVDLIFNRFAQADGSTSRRFGGTGLGLAISRKIVEALGGRIGVESQVGVGSTFWFTFNPPAADMAAPAPTPAPALPSGPTRVLVVDDNKINRDLFCVLTAGRGVEIVQAEDGLQAIEAVRSQRFDLVFMDIQMPVLDGVAATQEIRRLAQGGDTPIVALTANVLKGQVASYLAAGMSDHLAKPVSAKAILGAIATWSGRRHAPSPPLAEAG